MNNSMHSRSTNQAGTNRLLLFFLCTFVAAVVVAVSAMMMALGTGLASSPEEPVNRTSQILWGISGLSFIPCTILLVVLFGTHKRIVGMILGLTVIIAGILAAIGWFIDSGGEMPGTGGGDVIVIIVVVIPLIAGGLMLRQSRTLKS